MPDPEQVIEVPTISPEDVPMRAVLRDTQLAAQLVEVPTNPDYVFYVVAVQTLGWRTAAALIEQFGDTPARGGGGGSRGGSRAPRPGRDTARAGRCTNTGQGVVDVPVIMLFVFRQSKSFVFCAAIQFPRQSAGHSTEGRFHSAVLERLLPLLCTTVAHGPDSAAVAFTDKVVDIPGSEQWKVPQIQSSTELNDDFEAGLAHFSDSPERG